MCGRYTLFTDKEYQDIRKIIRAVQEKGHEVKTGEIYPTNPAPILVWEGKETVPQAVKWGWPKFQGSGVLINARAETAEEKNLFRKSVYTRRCVVPTTGFYEWDQEKAKYRFILPHASTLYLAGLYNEFQGERRFLILTTEAIGFLYPQPYAGDCLSGNDRYLAGGHRKSGAHASLAAARTSYCYTIKALNRKCKLEVIKFYQRS